MSKTSAHILRRSTKKCQRRIDDVERVHRHVPRCGSECSGLNVSVRISRAAHEDLTKSATRYAENPHRGCVDKGCSLIFHYDCWREEPAHIRAIQSHTSQNLDIVTFVHLGNSPDEDSIKAGGVLPEGFGEETKKSACYFSLVTALDKNPDTKYKAYNYLKHHHDRMYVSDLPAAQELLDFLKQPTAQYHVTTSLCRVPHEDSQCRKWMELLL